MPHVKGNKFKPKLPTPPPEPEPQPEPQPQPATQPGGGKKSKKQRKREAAAAAAAAADVAVEPAVPAAGAAAAPEAAAAAQGDGGARPPPSKKQRRGQQQPVLPAIPTVVAPAPKPGAARAEAAAAATSNWAALKAAMDAAKQPRPAHWRGKRKADQGEAAAGGGGGAQAAAPASRLQSMGSDTAPTKVVAIDCEMVGVGPNGDRSVLARVCVVNSAGNVLLDRYVRPKERVTDFRTRFSGIRPANLRDAAPFEEVQRQVAELLAGRIVVGHALKNDLEVLLLGHRRKDVRDTARYPPLMRAQARSGKLKARALRHLAAEQLGLAIQEGEHSPVDDARAALYLYMKHRKEWERWVAAGANHNAHPATQAAAAAAAAGGKLGLAAGGLMSGGSGSGQGGWAGKAAKAALLSLEELARKSAHLADL